MRKRKTRGTRITFKARGRRVTFYACTTSGRGKPCRKRSSTGRRTSAAARAQGRALARKYGFVSKGGKLYRKSPRRGLVRVRN